MMHPVYQSVFQSFYSHLAEARKLARGTVDGYSHDVRSFLEYLSRQDTANSAADSLANVRPTLVRSWLADRRTNGLDAATSRARAMSALKAFYRFLQRDKGIENAALMAMSGPKTPERLPRPTSETDTRDLLDTAANTSEEPWVQARDTAILTLLYAAGLRISEALAMTGENSPAPAVLRILGKRQKVRLVPLIPAAQDAINAYAALCPFPLNETTPLFYGVRGKPLSPRIVQRLMQHLRGALGLPDSATPHALRHAFASHLLSNGGDLRSIQGLMGHANPSTTQVYLGLEDARLTRAHKDAHPRA